MTTTRYQLIKQTSKNNEEVYRYYYFLCFAFADNTYCSQVTVDEYHKQSEICTENALVQMMNSILDNTQLHLKDKKQRLRQFQKHHPNLYNKSFSGMLWTNSSKQNRKKWENIKKTDRKSAIIVWYCLKTLIYYLCVYCIYGSLIVQTNFICKYCWIF